MGIQRWMNKTNRTVRILDIKDNAVVLTPGSIVVGEYYRKYAPPLVFLDNHGTGIDLSSSLGFVAGGSGTDDEFSSVIVEERDPLDTDTTYALGAIWINSTSQQCFILTQTLPGVVWRQFSSTLLGLLEDRPAFGQSGRLYFATDSGQLYIDTGAAWTAIGGGGGGAANLDELPDGATYVRLSSAEASNNAVTRLNDGANIATALQVRTHLDDAALHFPINDAGNSTSEVLSSNWIKANLASIKDSVNLATDYGVTNGAEITAALTAAIAASTHVVIPEGTYDLSPELGDLSGSPGDMFLFDITGQDLKISVTGTVTINVTIPSENVTLFKKSRDHSYDFIGPIVMVSQHPLQQVAAPLRLFFERTVAGSFDSSVGLYNHVIGVKLEGYWSGGFFNFTGIGDGYDMKYIHIQCDYVVEPFTVYMDDGYTASCLLMHVYVLRSGLTAAENGAAYGHTAYFHPHLNVQTIMCRFIASAKFALKIYSASGRNSETNRILIDSCHFESVDSGYAAIECKKAEWGTLICNTTFKCPAYYYGKSFTSHNNRYVYSATGQTVMISNESQGLAEFVGDYFEYASFNLTARQGSQYFRNCRFVNSQVRQGSINTGDSPELCKITASACTWHQYGTTLGANLLSGISVRSGILRVHQSSFELEGGTNNTANGAIAITPASASEFVDAVITSTSLEAAVRPALKVGGTDAHVSVKIRGSHIEGTVDATSVTIDYGATYPPA